MWKYFCIAYPEAMLKDAQIFYKECPLLPVRVVELELREPLQDVSMALYDN
jgi:hypothetical protein